MHHVHGTLRVVPGQLPKAGDPLTRQEFEKHPARLGQGVDPVSRQCQPGSSNLRRGYVSLLFQGSLHRTLLFGHSPPRALEEAADHCREPRLLPFADTGFRLRCHWCLCVVGGATELMRPLPVR